MMNLTSARISAALLLLTLPSFARAQPQVIDFNNVTPGDYSSFVAGDYVISNLRVSDRSGTLSTPAAETTERIFSGSPLMIHRTDGQSFKVHSIDADGSENAITPLAVRIQAFGYGDAEILNGLDDDGDGTIDEPDVIGLDSTTDGLSGLQTFFITSDAAKSWAFGPEESSFVIAHLDNIIVDVPEPAATMLLGLAAMVTLAARGRRGKVVAGK